MAEARSAVTEPRVCKVIDHDTGSWDAIAKTWYKSGIRRYYRTRNSIRNGMWPTSCWTVSFVCGIFLATMMAEPNACTTLTRRLWKLGDQIYILQGLPWSVRAIITSAIVGFAFVCVFMYIRQLLLRILLSYRGWMYGSGRSPSKKVMLWGLVVRLISGYQPSLYSFQRSLPRLPVPPLRETLLKLLESLKPICTEEEIAMLKKQSKEFEATIGTKLQKLLILRSWLTQNYVTDWWEKYVYLRSRVPLHINCNYYIIDQSCWRATNKPASRAAALMYNILRFKKMVDREELPPLVLRKTIPICMSQYERLFSTTRVPGEDMDELLHYDTKDSKHVVVVCKGVYYKLDVYDADNQYLCAKTLEHQIEWIVDDAIKCTDSLTETEKSISALTTLERNEWDKIRKRFLFSGVNNESRDLIERAICCIWLFDDSPEDLTERSKLTFHGDGRSIWFDKCFNVIVFANGRCGLNCEHSLADAPAYAHMWEYVLCKDILETTFEDDGSVFPPYQTFKQAVVKKPVRMLWEINDELNDIVTNSVSFAKKNNDDLDLIVVDCNKWGKGDMKKCKVSPDAFVQLAIQMAFYKDYGKFVQTYEASMTRLYLNGRTETVRSCTQPSVDFVLAMRNSEIPKEKKIRLLHAAAEFHTNMYKDAMNGKGIDRHLFALYVACKGLGYESDFLQTILTRPWTLSTSQTPHTQQTAVPDPNWKSFNSKLCPGGGFGPVSDEGYGISYIFPNESRIFFHISSKRSCSKTNSPRLGQYLSESLEEIRNLFNDVQ